MVPPFTVRWNTLCSSSTRLTHGLGDLRIQPFPLSHILAALGLQSLDDLIVFFRSALPFVELAWLQNVFAFRVDVRNVRRNRVTEVGIFFPLDRSFSDPLDDRRRVLNPYLL